MVSVVVLLVAGVGSPTLMGPNLPSVVSLLRVGCDRMGCVPVLWSVCIMVCVSYSS